MKNKKLLLIDDDDSISVLYKERLEMERYNVTIANNGASALEILEKESFDIILLDIMMPKIGGFDVLDVIRTKENLKRIPVIVLTAMIHEEPQIQSLSKGANEYIIKTQITPKELVDRIKKYL